jgi:hypothetical protein
MPIPHEYREIIDMLIEATAQSRVVWVEKSGGTTVLVHLPEFDVEIWSGSDESETEFVAVGLKVQHSKSYIDNWYVEEGDEHFDKLLLLFRAAQRRARNIDEKLQTLRNYLAHPGKIGFDDESSS